MEKIYRVVTELDKNDSFVKEKSYFCILYNGIYYNIDTRKPLSNVIFSMEHHYDEIEKDIMHLKALKTRKTAEKELLSKIKKLDIYNATIKTFGYIYDNEEVVDGKPLISCEINDIKNEYVYHLEDDIYKSISDGNEYKLLIRDDNYIISDDIEENKSYITDLELTNIVPKQAIKTLKKSI